MLLKWLDGKNQCGKVQIPLEFLAELMEISPRHCWRLLNQARKSGLIRFYKQSKKQQNLTIYLRSQYKVLRDCGYDRLPTTIVTDNFFKLNQIKEESICASTYDLQHKSRFKVLKLLKKREKPFIASLMALDRLSDRESEKALIDECETLTRSSKEIHGNWGNAHLIKKSKDKPFILIDDRNIFLGSTAIVHGTNQKSIADRMGCSVSTIYRHQKRLNSRQIVKYDSGIGIIAVCSKKLSRGNLPPLAGGNTRSIPSINIPESYSIEFSRPLSGSRELIYRSENRNLESIFKYPGTDLHFLPLTNFYLPSTDRTVRPLFKKNKEAFSKFVQESLKAMPYMDRKQKKSAEKVGNKVVDAEDLGKLGRNFQIKKQGREIYGNQKCQ